MAEDRIFGIHPVREALLGGKKLEKICIRQGLDSQFIREIMDRAAQSQIPMQFVPQEKLTHLVKTDQHQGVVAILAQLDYVELEQAVLMAQQSKTQPLVVLLDGISDVRNFGAIARTCECAGAGALFVPAKGGAAVNQDAIKTSAGALLRIPTCKVPNLRTAIYYLKESGFVVVGASEKADMPMYEFDFNRPVAVVMGSEGVGISSSVIALCDALVSIPLLGAIGSLNVSAATAVVLYEAVRQRR